MFFLKESCDSMKKMIGKICHNLNKYIIYCKGVYYTSIVNNKGGNISGLVEMSNPENIYIGKNSFVNGGQLIAGKESKICIGDDVMISYNVHIRTTYHIYECMDIPINKQGMEEANVIIGDNCWIGYGAQIMSGVSIGENSIVGAGAIVTKDVPKNVVVAGVPATIIKRRL